MPHRLWSTSRDASLGSADLSAGDRGALYAAGTGRRRSTRRALGARGNLGIRPRCRGGRRAAAACGSAGLAGISGSPEARLAGAGSDSPARVRQLRRDHVLHEPERAGSPGSQAATSCLAADEGGLCLLAGRFGSLAQTDDLGSRESRGIWSMPVPSGLPLRVSPGNGKTLRRRRGRLVLAHSKPVTLATQREFSTGITPASMFGQPLAPCIRMPSRPENGRQKRPSVCGSRGGQGLVTWLQQQRSLFRRQKRKRPCCNC